MNKTRKTSTKRRSRPLLSEVPGDFEAWRVPDRKVGAIASAEHALTLSAVYAALRLYQSQIASLPLVVYRRDPDGGRTRATDHPTYHLLHDQPNPAHSRVTFLELVLRDLFLQGEAFVQVRRDGNGKVGNVLGLYPVPWASVKEVYVDEEWHKAYVVGEGSEPDVLFEQDVIHLIHQPDEYGIRGVSLVKYAADNLGLHRGILDAAGAFYANAVRPSGYLKFAGKLDKDAVANIKKDWKDEHGGARNVGSLPILTNGDFVPFSTSTAEDARILEALGNINDVARWFGLSPSDLGDRSNTKYASLSADNTATYQRSIRPVLDKVETHINNVLFAGEKDVYCEFLTEAILRGDPLTMSSVDNTYIQAGVLLRSEVRERLNLPPVPGLDTPLQPANQVPVEDPAAATQGWTTLSNLPPPDLSPNADVLADPQGGIS